MLYKDRNSVSIASEDFFIVITCVFEVKASVLLRPREKIFLFKQKKVKRFIYCTSGKSF